jgi:hypothetical protein
MKYIFYSFVSLLLFSCSQAEDSEVTVVESFPVTGKLISTVISVPPVILAPANMCISGDKLIIFYTKKDTVLDIFQLPECKYLFSTGVRGRGPDDFLGECDVRSLQPAENGFSIISGYGLLRRFIIREKNIFAVSNKNINTDFIALPVNGFNTVNDTLSIAFSDFEYNEGNEFVQINTETGKSRFFSPFPVWSSAVWAKQSKAFAYIKNTVPHPSGTKFASFYVFFKRWRIYDSNTKLLKDIAVNIHPYAINHDFYQRTIYYYNYPRASDEYIYVLCKDGKASENSDNETKLQVWDWNGNPVASLILDRKIDFFAVYEKERKIYAVNTDEEHEDKIYVYSITLSS